MDESGFAHDMPRLYGDSMKGKRCYGQHDWHAKARTNVIGAQLNGKLTTVCTFDCHINSDIFHAWVMCQRYFRLTTFCYFKMSSFC
ncbi:transposase [Candidatus Regiella endosymbiont of Tuberolachnus salignus]|uniref:transposase n=1 Tax=Candidatus Regiella endosymbiont of Tuberolachnus salignus TaxID=3077956 RepID=UPI0030D046D7